MAGRQRHEGRAGSTGPTLSVTVRRAARLAAGTVALVGGVWCSSVAGASQTRSGGRDGGGTTWPPDPSADVQPPAIPDSVSVTQAQSWLAGALQLRAQELTSLENDVSNADNLPPSVRTQLNGDLTTASNGIAGLTASVQKASTLAALRVDATAMVLAYRVFSVVEPEVHLTVVAERQLGVARQISGLQPGLETAIKTEQGSRTGTTLEGLEATLTSDLATLQSSAGAVVTDMAAVSPSSYGTAVPVISADTKVVSNDWGTVSNARGVVGRILSLLAGQA